MRLLLQNIFWKDLDFVLVWVLHRTEPKGDELIDDT